MTMSGELDQLFTEKSVSFSQEAAAKIREENVSKEKTKTFESDLGDGWEDGRVHNDPEDIRQSALEMGTNIILYALSR